MDVILIAAITLDGFIAQLPSIATGNTITFVNLAEDGTAFTQTELNLIMDSSTINMMGLLHMKPADQIDFMKKVGGIDTDAVEKEYKDKYADRRVLNRVHGDAQTLRMLGDLKRGAGKRMEDVGSVRVDPPHMLVQLSFIEDLIGFDVDDLAEDPSSQSLPSFRAESDAAAMPDHDPTAAEVVECRHPAERLHRIHLGRTVPDGRPLINQSPSRFARRST